MTNMRKSHSRRVYSLFIADSDPSLNHENFTMNNTNVDIRFSFYSDQVYVAVLMVVYLDVRNINWHFI